MRSSFEAAALATLCFLAAAASLGLAPAPVKAATIDQIPANAVQPIVFQPPLAQTPLQEPKAEIVVDSQSVPSLQTFGKPASLSDLVEARDVPGTLDAETECLAGAIYFEARSEPLDGQLAVADVIINRTTSGRFPGSVCGVVFQPHQFSFVRGGGMPAIQRAGAQWKRAVAIAQIARNDLWDSSVGEALFFHASCVSPRWKLKRVGRIGNHIFYR